MSLRFPPVIVALYALKETSAVILSNEINISSSSTSTSSNNSTCISEAIDFWISQQRCNSNNILQMLHELNIWYKDVSTVKNIVCVHESVDEMRMNALIPSLN